ncbi:MAG TPA: PIN domain-containing protein [Solirubrobacterales bacterium]|nr:PIN domain-containing protein [Solirubrobacterales bacterium]
MAIALDSNVVVGFLDRSDKLHEAADGDIRGLLQSGEQLTVSVITYAELMTGARLGHHDEKQVEGFLHELVSRILPVDVAVADRAASLRAQTRSVAMPDALIVATAELAPEVTALISGDRALAGIEGLGCAVVLVAP